MLTTQLQIRPSRNAELSAAAWLLPGGDAAAWLRAIAAWPAPHVAVRIFVLPRSRSDRAPSCALVTLADGAEIPKNGPAGGAPYGRPTARLYVPIDAEFEPSVSPSELANLLADDRTYVWRPHLGLVAFEPADALRVSDLATIGPQRECDWRRATPGVALAGRLIALSAAQTPTVEEMLHEGQDDIGSNASSLKSLPPIPGESKVPDVSKAVGWLALPFVFLLQSIARLIAWLTARFPHTAQARTWINSLEDWARKWSQPRPRPALTPSQQRELDRLLHLLENDPDQGLRYALPLFSPPPRGVDPASGKLTERDANFDLSRLAGGRRATAWQTSAEVHAQLARRYRELANRELSLGRHRRAAYIFAELLHDMSAAAQALVAGGFWREAAILYRDRLKNNHEAARCLEQGGLYTEAIELLETLERYEQAGDLYERIGQPDAAAVAYRREVAARLDRNDRPAAAQLLEKKLAAPDEALAVLDSGWPNSAGAIRCLHGAFDLLGRTGRAAEMPARLEALRTTALPDQVSVEVHGVLVDVATRFPDDAVRAKAGDVSRLLVAEAWEEATPGTRRQLTSLIPGLAPEDRLLRRDCTRVTEQSAPAPLPLPRPTSKGSLRDVKFVRQLQAPGIAIWQRAITAGDAIFLAGWQQDHIVVARVAWQGEHTPDLRRWQVPTAEGAPLILESNRADDHRVLVHCVSRMTLTPRRFSATDGSETESFAGAIDGVTDGLLAAAFSPHGVTWLLEDCIGGPALRAIDRHGNLWTTKSLAEREIDPRQVRMHARSDSVFIAAGNILQLCNANGKWDSPVDLESPIFSLAGVAQHARFRIAVGLRQGAAIWWDSITRDSPTILALDLEQTLVEFNLAGHLIVAGPMSAEIYATGEGRAQLIGKCSGWRVRPIAVLRAAAAHEFAIVTADGKILIYRVD